MEYYPSNPPSDPAKLPGFLRDEFLRMQKVLLGRQKVLRLVPLHAQPDKFEEGDVVAADGTDWNPGSGKGVYRYNGSAWVFLG
jgi:hypothetical protein